MTLPAALSSSGNPNATTWHRSRLTSRRINGQRWQVCIYYDVNKRVVVAKRNLTAGGDWQAFVYDGTGGRPNLQLGAYDQDHFNSAAGIDRDGFVHFTWDGHRSYNTVPIQYRKSSEPVDQWQGAVTDNLQFTSYDGGNGSNHWNYPSFFRDPAGNLYYTYRRGTATAASGNQVINVYDDDSGQWSGYGATNGIVVQGIGSPARGVYAGMVPAFAENWDGAGNGRMWVTWNWRYQDSFGSDGDYENVNAMYYEGGTWKKPDGTSQTIPATNSNASSIVTARYDVNGWWPGTTSYGLACNADGSDVVFYYPRREFVESVRISIDSIGGRVGGTNQTRHDTLYPFRAFFDARREKFVYLLHDQDERILYRAEQTSGIAWGSLSEIGDKPFGNAVNYHQIDHDLMRDTGRLHIWRMQTGGDSGAVDVFDGGYLLDIPLRNVRTQGAAVSATVAGLVTLRMAA